jgi:tetratricopeptide (TPR) repeat protein
MATSEIEKLERRYAENPHGLTFAPLAEVHRKNGDVTRALELLRVGLELHPNYIPASIVLGRCQQDMGDLPAAEEAFAHVLRLDDENVIALKSLADINERQDRLDDAERWLRRLVSVDRSNDEARQQLQRIETAKQKDGRSAPAPAAASEVALVDAPPAEPPARAAIAAERLAEPAEIVPLELTDDLKKEVAEPAPEPALQDSEPAAASLELPPESLVQESEATAAPGEPAAPLPGLESAEFEPPRGSPRPLGLEIETESDVVLRSSGASEFSVPDASQDLAALAAKWNASRPRNPGRRASDRPAAESREAAIKAEPVSPAEPPQPPPTPQPTAPARAYSARETNGQSIQAFFQALLIARPPADSSASTSSQSGTGRPVQDAPALTTSPRGGSTAPAPSVPGQGKDGMVSFDDFFGSAAGDSSLAPGDEPGKDDLDQFHSWLQNLKR